MAVKPKTPVDLALPFEHLVVILMELGRNEWYAKVIDRRTNFHTSAGGQSRDPVALVQECWDRLCSEGMAGGGCDE